MSNICTQTNTYKYITTLPGMEAFNLSDKDRFLLERIKVMNPASVFYHLSTSNKIKHLSPRVPNNEYTKAGVENGTISRACFSTSIDRCCIALCVSGEINVDKAIEEIKQKGGNPNEEVFFIKDTKKRNTELFVYEVRPKSTIYKPTSEIVVDANVTDEHWVLHRTKVQLVGQISVYGVVPSKLDPKNQYTIHTDHRDYKHLNGVQQVFFSKMEMDKKILIWRTLPISEESFIFFLFSVQRTRIHVISSYSNENCTTI